MHRFFVPQDSISDKHVIFTGQQARQLRSVLRMKVGDRIVVLDSVASQYEVELESIERNTATGLILSRMDAAGEPSVKLTLFQTLSKHDKFELALQKCTEVGASHFVPVITKRGLIRETNALTANKITRFRRIIAEAAEQSHRALLPELAEPVTFPNAIQTIADYDLTIIAATDSNATSLSAALEAAGRSSIKTIALFIGPEGGFTEDEVAAATDAGAVQINLGPRILRTETAAVVTTALILHELGQMRPE